MEVADTFLILTLRLIHTKPIDDKCNPAHTAYISKGNAMSKSIKQVRVPVSTRYMAVLELYGKCKELGYCDCGGFFGCNDPDHVGPPLSADELAAARNDTRALQ
jgi:hypothetical protein